MLMLYCRFYSDAGVWIPTPILRLFLAVHQRQCFNKIGGHSCKLSQSVRGSPSPATKRLYALSGHIAVLHRLLRTSSMVCLSICYSREPYKNGWTDRHTVWDIDSGQSGGLKEACITLGCTLTQPGEYDWTVLVRPQLGLMSNYFDHLLSLKTVMSILVIWNRTKVKYCSGFPTW